MPEPTCDEIEDKAQEILADIYRINRGKTLGTLDIVYYAYMKGRNDLQNEMFKESSSKNVLDAR